MNMISIKNLTEKDFRDAELLLQQELINEFTWEEIFRAGIYCILAQAERYDKQIKIYRKLLTYGFTAPLDYIKNPDGLRNIIRFCHYPNSKLDRITKFSKWYLKEKYLPRLLIHDITVNNRVFEKEIRNQFAEEAPSIGYKTASLLMIKCGYTDVIPIDIWVLRYLQQIGYKVDVPDYMTVGGMTEKTYLELENILREIAESYDVSLAIFQGALWGKWSTWNIRKEKKLIEFV